MIGGALYSVYVYASFFITLVILTFNVYLAVKEHRKQTWIKK